LVEELGFPRSPFALGGSCGGAGYRGANVCTRYDKLGKREELSDLTAHTIHSRGLSSIVNLLFAKLILDDSNLGVKSFIHIRDLSIYVDVTLEQSNLSIFSRKIVLHLKLVTVYKVVFTTAAIRVTSEKVTENAAVESAQARADDARG
jgi:hypothetical protein